jgi:hypothetical protein
MYYVWVKILLFKGREKEGNKIFISTSFFKKIKKISTKRRIFKIYKTTCKAVE